MAATKKVTDTVVEVDNNKSEKKVFGQEDLIPCKSNCNGQLLCEGTKSGIMYTWADYGDVEYMEYRDLQFLVKSPGNRFINDPRIIILDEDFISEYPALQKVYDNMNSESDYKDFILNTSINVLRRQLDTLSKSEQDTIKRLAGSLIEEHLLDSVTKIKVLDEFFGTQLLLTLAQE